MPVSRPAAAAILSKSSWAVCGRGIAVKPCAGCEPSASGSAVKTTLTSNEPAAFILNSAFCSGAEPIVGFAASPVVLSIGTAFGLVQVVTSAVIVYAVFARQ